MTYSSTVPSRGAGFVQLLRAEWTKLRSLRSTWVCVGLTITLMVLLAYLAGKGNSTDANKFGPQRFFAVQLVHQPLTGDGSIVAHVAEQQATGPDAKAGLMITSSVTFNEGPWKPGTAKPMADVTYAAIMVTPGHGVEWQSDFTHEEAGSSGPAPRWLKLTRLGSVVTGYESPDGVAWTQVGTMHLTNLPESAFVGPFATSPPTGVKTVRRSPTSNESSPDYTLSSAVFDSVRVTGADGGPVTGAWQNVDTGGAPRELPNDRVTGSFTEDSGTFTVAGAGELGLERPGLGGDNDVVRDSLSGVFVALIALIVIAVLFITAEFRRGVIRTTFTATPRRGRVLAAKALVLAAIAFVTGVVAAVPAFLISQPLLRENGFAPPAYPTVSLSDGPVLRAVIGTGLVLALFAVLALALGALLRSGAASITLVIAVVVMPVLIGPFLTLDGEAWLKRVTPVAGMAIQQTRERWDDAIGPWPGIAVLCAWVAVALAAAAVQLRRRDA
ncbi:MAG TPA: ABC transporter permease subunit [Nocardioidaceae bacterium]|nr:ABC transporter permease subunit [Nocardioidaceae bacterium]